MKVLFVLNPLLTDYKKSGSALVAINIGLGLYYKGHEVAYIANEVIRDIIPGFFDIKLYIPEIKSRGYMKDTIDCIHSLEKYYDIIHVHIHQIGILEAIEKSNISKPIVYTQHTKNINNRFTYQYYPYAKELSMNTNRNIRIIMPSNSMIDVWKEYCKYDGEFPNVRVIRNGISDVDVELRDKRYDIITCSGIDRDKGILSLLNFTDKYNINSLFVANKREGSKKNADTESDYYIEFINKINKSYSSRHVEYMTNGLLRQNIADSKIYMTATRSESFGLTIAESISVGTPVLFIEEPSLCELLDDKSSVMIPRSELYRKSENSRLEIYKKYYDIICKKIDNKEITRETVISRFNELGCDYDSFINNHIKLYEELI